jgi:histidinol-phosphate aminotransferase
MKISRRRLLRRVGTAAAVAAAAPFPLDARVATARRGPAPVRLSRNESPYGPSREALAVIRQADVGALSLYPDIEYEALRLKIAAAHRVSADRIVLGAGATDVLRMIVDACLEPQGSLVVAQPTCDVISRWAERAGAVVVRVPLAHDWSHDLRAMRARCDARARLVYICNPNNPTGSLTRRGEIESFVRGLPRGIRVVIDEAYHHYVSPGADYASFLDRPIDDDRVMVVRTFSKAYGLAGIRLGYAVAHPAIAVQLTHRAETMGVASVAALAAAAALDDRSYLETIVGRVADDRQEFYNQANARMLRVIDSHANFVMLNTTRRAADIVNHFARNGIALPRPFPPLDEYVRVSLGTASDMDEFWRVWDLMSLAHTL